MTHIQMKSVLIVTVFLCCCCAAREPATYPRFNPLCFQRRPQPVNQTSVSVSREKEDAIAFNFSFPKFQSLKWEFDYIIRPSCLLELYIYGNFYVFEMFLKMIKFECKSLTKTPTNITFEVIKTGPKPRPKGMPPLNPLWWLRGTLIRVILKPIISYQPTTYFCTYSHEFAPKKSFPTAHVNVTLDIRGCPQGLYGKHCKQKCLCQNGGTCHPLDGSCLCHKEWTGRFCETLYPHIEINGTTTALYIGGQASITCHIYAINMTSTSLRWMFTSQDGAKHESLQEDVPFESSARHVRSLTIANFSEQMAGKYKCILITKHQVFDAHWNISSKGCITNTYGPWCEHTCDCDNGARCDPVEGCVCTKQFKGSKCQISMHMLGIVIGLSLVGLIAIPSAFLALKHVYTVWKRMKDIAIIRDEQLQYQASKGNPWAEILPEITEATPKNQLHERWGIPDEDVYIGKIIAEGSFSDIYKGHMIKKGKTYEVAIKMLKDDTNRQSVTDFFQEFQTLAEIYHHRHILQMLGIGRKFVAGQCKQIIVMEYMAKGSLLEVLRNSRAGSLDVACTSPPLTNGQLTNFIMDILNALAYLEFKQIIHRDIAARNMLVSSCMVVKLADFGFSRDVRTDGVYRLTDVEKKLPWKWMAYESLTDQKWTSKSDVWAFGILLWEVVTLGGAPYPGVTGPGRLIQMLQQTYRMEKPEHCSQEWYEIMKMCWNLDPEKRPRFTKLRCSFEKLKKNTLTHPQLSLYHGKHFAIDPDATDDDVEDDCGLVPVDYPGTGGNKVPGYVNVLF